MDTRNVPTTMGALKASAWIGLALAIGGLVLLVSSPAADAYSTAMLCLGIVLLLGAWIGRERIKKAP